MHSEIHLAQNLDLLIVSQTVEKNHFARCKQDRQVYILYVLEELIVDLLLLREVKF